MWVWGIVAALVALVVFQLGATMLAMHALREAVVFLLELGYVECVGPKGNMFPKLLDNERSFKAAVRIFKASWLLDRRWYHRTLAEYQVKWAVDGVATRGVQ